MGVSAQIIINFDLSPDYQISHRHNKTDEQQGKHYKNQSNKNKTKKLC